MKKTTNLKRPMLAVGLGAACMLGLCSDAATTDRERSTLSFDKKKAPYYSNRSLANEDTKITRAIIVIHGSGRKCEEYFLTMQDAIPSGPGQAHDWREKTIVLAPHFQEKDDAKKKECYWKDDWVTGGDSGGVSSYEVVDTLVARLRNGTFPNLRWIVITGHSAGGQFVQRYAAFTDIDLLPVPNAALVKFVPSNPSSYVYLNEYRFSDARNDWVVPHGKKSKDYNEFKYGLKKLDDYAKDRGAAWARTHLPRRWIELLAGTADVVADSSFDDSKEAMWQGDSRYVRAQLFDAFMDQFYAPNRFSVTPVPNVGHDHRAIYLSPQAKNALFFRD